VRASGRVRALTIDKDNLLRRIQEDPTLAFRIIQTMSRRIRELSSELAHYKS
jgi:CRP-like cAMP-binding protein